MGLGNAAGFGVSREAPVGDPEQNACVIELYADGELSGAFDALKPVKLTATQLANAIKVSNVMDVETEQMGEIHGTDEFMILGNGVTLDAEGESAKLVDRKTDAPLVTSPNCSRTVRSTMLTG